MTLKRDQAAGARHTEPPGGAQVKFEQALDAHRQGRIAEAENLYREVIATDARHTGALQHLGILAQQRGDFDESVRLLARAAEIAPADPLLQNNFGNVLRSRGDYTEAIAAYRAAVASDTGYVNALYNLADLLRERDEHAEAESCYQRVVSLAPADVGAWMGLGMALLEQGRDVDALPCFERAVALRPEDPICHYNLGNALRTVERTDAAARAFRSAIAIAPDYAEAHHNLGMALASSGEVEEAISEFREALRYRPDYAMACVSLASGLRRLGEYPEAEDLCRRALTIDADDAHALCELAWTLRARDRHQEALQALQRAQALAPADIATRLHIGELLLENDRWIEAAEYLESIVDEQPLDVTAHCALSKAYLKAHRTEAAIEACRKAIAADVDSADAHLSLGLTLRQTGDTRGAIDALHKALDINPEFAEAHNNLGLVYIDDGDMDAGVECYRKALALDPSLSVASLNLSQARRFGETDLPEIARVEGLLEDASLLDEDRINLHFALGKMFDDCRLYDQAFEHYVLGNRYKREHVRFDPDRFRRWAAKFPDIFTRAYFQAHAGLGSPSERPVFIVGMPRSGTTLVEQILASHPLVYGAGELTAIFDTVRGIQNRFTDDGDYPDMVVDLDPAAIRWGAEHYLDKLSSIDGEAARVTDKMPSNFFHLGLISVMFPHARIVHCRRDAMDVCVSNFVRLFTEGHYYSYDLSDIATYYSGYERSMAHWREVLPIQIYEVHYAELVNDQERISRGLVDYLGLEWDARCLAFHETKRSVRTASNWQVRQPIYKSAQKRWKNYARHLEKLESDLGYVEES